MKTFVWSDVHNRVGRLKTVLGNLKGDFDKRIFLGDWFDNFGDTPEHALRTAETLVELMQDPKNVFIEGNHDTAYRYRNLSSMCSGFTVEKSRAVNQIMGFNEWNRFKLFEEHDGFVFSHAGIGQDAFSHPIHGITMEEVAKRCQEGQDAIRSNIDHPVYFAGRANGGREPYSGITWLRWGDLKPLAGINQIVGHTPYASPQIAYGRIKKSKYNRRVRTTQENVKVDWAQFEHSPPKAGSLCSINFNLDTHNAHFITIEDGVVQIHLVLDYL